MDMKIGDKYIVVDSQGKIPSGLMVTLVSVKMNRINTKVTLKVIRNKNIIENFYLDNYNIKREDFISSSTDGHVMFYLNGIEAEKFLDGKGFEKVNDLYEKLK